ncbi:MAG: histidine phosphatase family protein [Pelobacteraceae bacterium]
MSRAGQHKSGCTVYLLRHGDSRPDEVRRFIGRTDHPLNETGRAQAE